MNLLDLHAPFPAAEIEWRVGSTNGDKSSGLALAYLTARHVMERLDAVCGPENWQDRYEFHGPRTVCYLSLRVGGEWVTKADGAGDSDVEAEKGAISDALKRAAVKWGIGRYLYDLGKIWVDLEKAGNSHRIKKDQYAKLETALVRQFGQSLRSLANEAPDAPPQGVIGEANPPHRYLDHFDAINGATTLDTLQAAFLAAKADKSLTKQEADDLIVAKDKRKAILTKPEVPPNFDNLPQPTREAVRNLSA